MAQINRNVGNKRLVKYLATMPGVQSALKKEANLRAVEARQYLRDRRKSHTPDGATIEVWHGRVDYYVVLDDPNAMQIEFGRKAEEREGANGETYTIAPAEGLHILRDTFPEVRDK